MADPNERGVPKAYEHTYTRLARERDEARAEVERLTKERDEARLDRNEEIATILRQRADRLTDHPDEKNDAVNHACARELWKLADAIQGDDTYEAEHIPAMQQELGRLRARVRELEAETNRLYSRLTKYEDA